MGWVVAASAGAHPILLGLTATTTLTPPHLPCFTGAEAGGGSMGAVRMCAWLDADHHLPSCHAAYEMTGVRPGWHVMWARAYDLQVRRGGVCVRVGARPCVLHAKAPR